MGVVILTGGSGSGSTVSIVDNGDGTVTVTIDGTPTTFNSDDFDRYANLAAFPVAGDQDIIYLDEATNTLYQWDGAAYQSLSGSGGGSALEVEDDGTSLTTGATKLNFVGFTVTEPVANEITVSTDELPLVEVASVANVIDIAFGNKSWIPLNGGGVVLDDTVQIPLLPTVTGTDGVLAELIWDNQTNHTLNLAFDAGNLADIASDTIHVLADSAERKIPPNRGGFLKVHELGGEIYVEVEGLTEFG